MSSPEKFMKVHAELVKVRTEIRDCEHRLAMLRSRESGLEGASNYEFHNLVGAHGEQAQEPKR